MTRFNRDEWGAREPRPGPGRLRADQVEGIALHWPGIARPLTTVAAVKRALQGWQRLHMDTNGWSDIAYQEAIDQAGNTYLLRGLRDQSGANGDQDVNERFGAILLVIAAGEQPSEALVNAVRRRVRAHRDLFPHSRRIVGHGDIRPGGTLCPGAVVTRHIRAGVFDPDKEHPND